MDHHFPSPPSSPTQHNQEVVDKVICGSCDKVLSSDWFCSDCHKRCETCNRFLSADEHCTRCWSFDTQHNTFVRKQRSTTLHHYHQYQYQRQHNFSFALSSFQPPPSPPTSNQHVLSNPTMNYHHHAVVTSTMTNLPHSFY